MRLNVSEVLTLDECEQLWDYRWVQGKGTAPSPAMALGSQVHLILADMMLGKPVDLEQVEDEVVKGLLQRWKDVPKPWTEVIQVEEELELKVPGALLGDEDLVLFGKPDAVVRWKGRLWHVQHKTLAASKPLAVFAQGIKISLHEGLYKKLIEEKFGEPCRGTMLNVVRKISKKAFGEFPESGLHIEFLPIPDSVADDAVLDLTKRARKIQWSRGGPSMDRRPYRNRKTCTGQFGNSLCPFYQVCWNGGTLDDFEEVNPLAAYAPTAATPE